MMIRLWVILSCSETQPDPHKPFEAQNGSVAESSIVQAPWLQQDQQDPDVLQGKGPRDA
jgi:hypothetical protein